MESKALFSRQGVLMPVHIQVPKNVTNQASLVLGKEVGYPGLTFVLFLALSSVGGYC